MVLLRQGSKRREDISQRGVLVGVDRAAQVGVYRVDGDQPDLVVLEHLLEGQ